MLLWSWSPVGVAHLLAGVRGDCGLLIVVQAFLFSSCSHSLFFQKVDRRRWTL